MPGIVGLITKQPREWAEPQLTRMVESLRHESFYVAGTWIDESLGMYVGWVARKNSFSDAMPVRNERGDVVLFFSGEDYPEPGTTRRLKERGHEFEENDGCYLVHVYEEDQDFFKNLNGRFQGLLADRVRRTATLFNDRFGLQRIYIHEAQDAFYFSAEAKAILAVRPELRSTDPQSLGEYIACGCVLENRTLFRGIHVLPPASTWTFRGGALEEKKSYFEPREWEEQEPLDGDSYYNHLRDAFTTRLPRYFNGHEKIGVSLTGGLDTRIIMAWRKAPAGSLPCYTFGSMYRENQDVYLARRVAEICGQPYQVVTVDGECLQQFPHYAERTLYLTDGCVDISRSADLYNNEMARRIAPVRMVGTFGSEIIRGAVMFKPSMPSADIFRPEMLAEVSRAAETYREQLRGHRTSMVAFRQPAAYHFGVLMLEQTQLTLRAPYLDNEIVRTVFRAPKVEDGEDVRLRLIRDGSPELARLRTDRGLGISNPIVSALSRGFWEFTFKAEYAYDYGMPQWVAQVDHSLAPLHLERLWMGRHKLFHFRWWYRTILAKYVQEMLLDSRTLARPYLERKGVEAVVRGHLKGNRNYTTEIHRLLSLELMHRLFVDAS
ncbi:MAG: asparagine synthase-related protein [Candidatus Acidiferrales bacterium]